MYLKKRIKKEIIVKIIKEIRRERIAVAMMKPTKKKKRRKKKKKDLRRREP